MGDLTRRMPALDGLRGLAIALVVAGHTFLDTYSVAGPVGVSVFFTLSGYLITSLLLAERDRTGRIELGAFYLRRARRLLPALFVFITVMLICGYGLSRSFGTWGTAWPALLYVANFNRGGAGMGHLWSLAIEEQFYLAFPLLLIVGRRLSEARLLRLLVGLALASAAWRVGLYLWSGEGARSYFGTDTSACLLLIGCALAVWLRTRPGLPVLFAGPAVVVILALGFVDTLQSDVVYVPLVAALASAAGIASVQTDAPGWLTWPPLVLLGRRSYALYLWHVPMLSVIWPTSGGGPIAGIVCIGAAWGLALLSWRYVESPFMRSRAVPADALHRMPPTDARR